MNIRSPSHQIQIRSMLSPFPEMNGDIDTIRTIENPSPELQIAVLKAGGPMYIKFIKNQCLEAQLFAAKAGNSLSWINDPCEEVQLIAVERNWRALSWIDNPSDAVIEMALTSKNSGDARAILLVDKPSMELCKLAIKVDPMIIVRLDRCVDSKDIEELQLFALETDYRVFNYLNWPSDVVKSAHSFYALQHA